MLAEEWPALAQTHWPLFSLVVGFSDLQPPFLRLFSLSLVRSRRWQCMAAFPLDSDGQHGKKLV